ncbi:MAG: hypothetical protein IPH11_16260 [Ignavibacteriales bacterium]|nr:hypothetical protein [Ignavibacteriales bacterium]
MQNSLGRIQYSLGYFINGIGGERKILPLPGKIYRYFLTNLQHTPAGTGQNKSGNKIIKKYLRIS